MTIVLKTVGMTQKRAIAAKLGIEEKFIKVIHRAESEFWKVPRLAKLPDSTPLTPLGRPSALGIILADEDQKEETMPEISM